MCIPRVRFTVRATMAAVAISSVTLGGIIETQRRRERFERLAHYHWRKYPASTGCLPMTFVPHSEWHAQMSRKYTRASSYPWLPVAPDPPAPLDDLRPGCLCAAGRLAVKQELLERAGWDTNGCYPSENDDFFFAEASRGEERVEVRAPTEDQAWQRVYERTQALGSPTHWRILP